MKKFIFLHHQRCGGTSFRQYFFHNTHSFAYNNNLRKNIVNEIQKEKVLIYEIEPGIYLKELEGLYNFFTILRNPIDRALSWIELHSDTNIQPNPRNLFHLYRDNKQLSLPQFWNNVYNKIKGHPSFSINFNIFNTYIKSFANVQTVNKITYKHFDLTLKRLEQVDCLLFDRNTFYNDVIHYANLYDLPFDSSRKNERLMASNDNITNPAPDWLKEFISEKSSKDIELWNMMKEKTTNNLILSVFNQK